MSAPEISKQSPVPALQAQESATPAVTAGASAGIKEANLESNLESNLREAAGDPTGYQQTEYTKPAPMSPRRATVEDDDEENHPMPDITAEEIAEREAKLDQGSKNLKAQVQETPVIPLDIALVIERSAWIYRKAWTLGKRPKLLEKLEEVNIKIRAMNKVANRSWKKGNLAGGEPILHFDGHLMDKSIFDLIETMRDKFADSLKSKTISPQTAKEVVLTCLAVRAPLDRMALTWQAILTPETKKVIDAHFTEGVKHISSAERELLFAWLEREWRQPRHYQDLVVRATAEPIQNFFDELELGETANAIKEIKKIESVNEKLGQANEEVGIVRDDHVIPIDFFHDIISKYSSLDATAQLAFVPAQRAVLGALLQAFGHEHLPAMISGTPDEKTSGECQAQVEQQLIQWRGRNYNWLADAAPSTSSTTSAPSLATSGIPTAQFTPSTAPADAPDTDMEEANSPLGTADQPHHQTSSGFRSHPIRGPIYENRVTEYGLIVGSKSTGGFGGSRHILNVGTSEHPVYKCFPGAAFGKGTGANMVNAYPLPTATHIKSKTAKDLKSVLGVVQVDSKSVTRNPITYFPVVWQGSNDTEWLTRTEITQICGKIWLDKHCPALISDWRDDLNFLDDLRARNIHPDTNQPLKEADRASMPWLFKTHLATELPKSTMPSRADPVDASDTAHIGLPQGGLRGNRSK